MDDYFTKQQLKEYFDAHILSCDVGLAKPDEDIYIKICNSLGVIPREALLLDDTIEYCKGSELVGMSYVKFTNNTESITKINIFLLLFLI